MKPKEVANELRNYAIDAHHSEAKRVLSSAADLIESLARDAERYLDVIFEMADDGWLMHGTEGMSDVQEAVYKVCQEHPTYKKREAAAMTEPPKEPA